MALTALVAGLLRGGTGSPCRRPAEHREYRVEAAEKTASCTYFVAALRIRGSNSCVQIHAGSYLGVPCVGYNHHSSDSASGDVPWVPDSFVESRDARFAGLGYELPGEESSGTA